MLPPRPPQAPPQPAEIIHEVLNWCLAFLLPPSSPCTAHFTTSSQSHKEHGQVTSAAFTACALRLYTGARTGVTGALLDWTRPTREVRAKSCILTKQAYLQSLLSEATGTQCCRTLVKCTYQSIQMCLYGCNSSSRRIRPPMHPGVFQKIFPGPKHTIAPRTSGPHLSHIMCCESRRCSLNQGHSTSIQKLGGGV